MKIGLLVPIAKAGGAQASRFWRLSVVTEDMTQSKEPAGWAQPRSRAPPKARQRRTESRRTVPATARAIAWSTDTKRSLGVDSKISDSDFIGINSARTGFDKASRNRNASRRLSARDQGELPIMLVSTRAQSH